MRVKVELADPKARLRSRSLLEARLADVDDPALAERIVTAKQHRDVGAAGQERIRVQGAINDAVSPRTHCSDRQ